MDTIPPEIIQLGKKLHINSNQEKADQMKKYMKDRFEFFGIPAPQRKDIFKPFIGLAKNCSVDACKSIVEFTWKQPQREWQYFGMEFLFKTVKKEHQEFIGFYSELVTKKSWWDTVDFIASYLIGDYFRHHPTLIRPITREWMESGNIWLQRSCLLFQLKYKDRTDSELLEGFIHVLAGSREFFIQKAIGWALRQYAKTDPVFVADFVKKNQLSELSKREAIKHLGA